MKKNEFHVNYNDFWTQNEKNGKYHFHKQHILM